MACYSVVLTQESWALEGASPDELPGDLGHIKQWILQGGRGRVAECRLTYDQGRFAGTRTVESGKPDSEGPTRKFYWDGNRSLTVAPVGHMARLRGSYRIDEPVSAAQAFAGWLFGAVALAPLVGDERLSAGSTAARTSGMRPIVLHLGPDDDLSLANYIEVQFEVGSRVRIARRSVKTKAGTLLTEMVGSSWRRSPWSSRLEVPGVVVERTILLDQGLMERNRTAYLVRRYSLRWTDHPLVTGADVMQEALSTEILVDNGTPLCGLRAVQALVDRGRTNWLRNFDRSPAADARLGTKAAARSEARRAWPEIGKWEPRLRNGREPLEQVVQRYCTQAALALYLDVTSSGGAAGNDALRGLTKDSELLSLQECVDLAQRLGLPLTPVRSESFPTGTTHPVLFPSRHARGEEKGPYHMVVGQTRHDGAAVLWSLGSFTQVTSPEYAASQNPTSIYLVYAGDVAALKGTDTMPLIVVTVVLLAVVVVFLRRSRKPLVASVLVAASLSACSETTAAELMVPKVVDLGQIAVSGSKDGFIPVRNPGNRKVEIFSDKTSCTCIEVLSKVTTLEPNESGRILIRMHGKRVEEIRERVLLRTTDPAQPHLSVEVFARVESHAFIAPRLVCLRAHANQRLQSAFQVQVIPKRKDTLVETKWICGKPGFEVNGRPDNARTKLTGHPVFRMDLAVGAVEAGVYTVPFTARLMSSSREEIKTETKLHVVIAPNAPETVPHKGKLR